MYRLIDHKQNILRPKGDQSFHTVWALSVLRQGWRSDKLFLNGGELDLRFIWSIGNSYK